VSCRVAGEPARAATSRRRACAWDFASPKSRDDRFYGALAAISAGGISSGAGPPPVVLQRLTVHPLARARWTYEQLVEKAFTPALGFSCLVFQFAKRGDFVILSEYLKRLDLIKVGTGGRSLTSCGRRYLV
jgi:hypothetical protein